jgi:hypothetical protein
VHSLPGKGAHPRTSFEAHSLSPSFLMNWSIYFHKTTVIKKQPTIPMGLVSVLAHEPRRSLAVHNLVIIRPHVNIAEAGIFFIRIMK